MAETKLAVAFPGQGIQKPGMAKALVDTSAWHLFAEASELIGYDLGTLCLEGPAETLADTAYAQMSIFVTSLALWELNKNNLSPQIFTGHSLGEITALTAAGALSFADGVRLVKARGEIMAQSVPGGMVAILGLDLDTISKLCGEVQATSFVQVANENSPAQTVVSGEEEGLELISALALEHGAKRVVRLNVAGPFHSQLMQQAADKFANVVEELELNTCHTPVLSNDGETLLTQPQDVKAELVGQLTSPVRFTKLMGRLVELGIAEFMEVSPESVLIPLARRCERNLKFTLVSDGGI